MNASRKTKIIAYGIYLRAAVQDLPLTGGIGAHELNSWDLWCRANPQYADLVIEAQNELFDRVLEKL